jgi:HSP20 family protein
MSTLTKWNPFTEFDEMQNRLGAFFNGFPTFPGSNGKNLMLPNWSPLVDITEDDQEYMFKADLPDVRKDDVKVTVEDGLLSITGERKSEKNELKKKYHRLERFFGKFERAFTVPTDADAAKIKAEFKDGTLMIHLPKSPSAKPKSIEVKVQ